MLKRLWWVWALVAVVVLVPTGFIAAYMISNAIGRVTVEGSRTVYWREFPGVAGLDPQEVLDGPTVEEGILAGEKLVAEMRDAVSAEFDLDWVGDPNDDGDYRAVHPDVQNYFGGDSMLATINSPASQTTTVPTGWADKQRIIEILGEVADRHGYSAPVLDHEREYVTEADRRRDFGGGSPAEQVFVSGIIEGPVGQWVMFSLQDPTKDVDGRFEERLSIGDWQRASVTLSYGANALVPAADRAEFERRLQPFLGLEPPEPYES